MIATTKPIVGGSSPWGRIERVQPLAEGIWFVHTSKHGGVKLSPDRCRQMPDYFIVCNAIRCRSWWEADLDWTMPAAVFEDEIRSADHCRAMIYALERRRHLDILKNWQPEAYGHFCREIESIVAA